MHALAAKYLVIATVRQLCRPAKNHLRKIAGIKASGDHDNHLFFCQYLIQLTTGRTIRKLTCRGLHGEGACSQALMIISAIIFARATGLTYVHTPFSTIAHADRPVTEWTAAWEELFNLGFSEETIQGNKSELVDYSKDYPSIRVCFGWDVFEVTEPSQFLRAFIPDLRKKYYLNKSPRANTVLMVAVHMRRGDVGVGHEVFTSTAAIERTIVAVKSVLDTLGITHRIYLYSQGLESDFAELKAFGVQMFLNVDAIWTIQEMIEADLLIMAKGSFSYAAALISDGIKICEPHEYYTPLEPWIIRQKEGGFDTSELHRQLAEVRGLLPGIARRSGSTRT
jgi:hypothetical protein